MTSTDLDPRFDPRFQRGYDAERYPTIAPGVAPDAVPAAPVVAAPAVLDEVTVEGVELDELPDEPIRRRNPYFIALVALPFLLLGGGTYLIAWYANELLAVPGGSFWQDYTAATLVPMIAPALILTGFAALIVVLAQLALGSGRRG